jgi:hypothetical protein
VTGDDVRVGDVEREAVAEQLRDHWAAGRLTLDELDRRLADAYGAATRGDLGVLVSDLPAEVVVETETGVPPVS